MPTADHLLVKVLMFQLGAVDDKPDGMSIKLGERPTDVPEPFAELLRTHVAQRPNLQTGAGSDSPWLFPSTLAGRHFHPNTVMHRLRDLGVNLLGARNRPIGELVLAVPPVLVAEALGYSRQVAFLCTPLLPTSLAPTTLGHQPHPHPCGTPRLPVPARDDRPAPSSSSAMEILEVHRVRHRPVARVVEV